jgi:hypothetical protein
MMSSFRFSKTQGCSEESSINLTLSGIFITIRPNKINWLWPFVLAARRVFYAIQEFRSVEHNPGLNGSPRAKLQCERRQRVDLSRLAELG